MQTPPVPVLLVIALLAALPWSCWEADRGAMRARDVVAGGEREAEIDTLLRRARLGEAPRDEWVRCMVLLLHEEGMADFETVCALDRNWPKAFGPNTVLADALEHRRPEVRRNAVKALARLGPSEHALSHLRRATSDRDPAVREAAVQCVGDLQDQGSRFLLLLALKDSAWSVRAAAAASLAKLRPPDVLRYLVRAADDPDAFVRYSVRQAVVGLGPKAGNDQLRKAGAEARSAPERLAAALAMASAGSAEGAATLAATLEDPAAEGRVEAARFLAKAAPAEARALFGRLEPAERDLEVAGVMREFLRRGAEGANP